LLPSEQSYVTTVRACLMSFTGLWPERPPESPEMLRGSALATVAHNYGVARLQTYPSSGPSPAYRRYDERQLRARTGNSTESRTPLTPEYPRNLVFFPLVARIYRVR
jgi:hypothetical protein